MLIDDTYWAGTEGALAALKSAEKGIQARVEAGAFVDDDDDEDSAPRLLTVQDGIATIEIKGSLVNSDSPYLQYFGLIGYPEIREAVIAAAQDPEVKQILLDIDSGGGAVSGVDDTAKLIRNINDNVKPVTTLSDGTMASAAYWLGSAAGEVYAGKTSMVGSIGVIAVHKEYSEAYKKEGVGVNVIRAGKEKALANSNEKLSDKGRQQIQQAVDASYQVFVEHVAEMRGKSYEYADKQMAQGQEFIGTKAADVGLVDGIKTFDAVVTDLKQKIIASSEKLMHNHGKGGQPLMLRNATSTSGDTIMARKALSEQDVAALAAGAPMADTTSHIETPEVPADPAPATDATAEASAETAEVKVEADTSSATVQLLVSQLKDKDAALLEAGIKIAKLEEKVAETAATQGPLIEIAGKSINNMQIAMGGSALSLEGMAATSVLAEHKRLSESFASKFKVGGVSAVVGNTEETPKATAVDPRHLARVNAARFTK